VRASDLILSELSPERFSRTHAVLQEGLAQGVSPGFVVGYWSQSSPGEAFLTAIGSRRMLPSIQPMKIDTIFDLASVSKIYATATLAALLVDRGWLNYDAEVREFFPDYRYEGIRIRHLLSHTAGFAAWAPFWEKMRVQFAPKPVELVSVPERQKMAREWVLGTAPEVPPGERVLYSDISFLILGFVLEGITRMPLDQAVRHFVWEPLGAENSYYVHVTNGVKDRDENVAATEDSDWRGGILQGQVHDDNCWAMGGFAGHAGVFGDARDLMHYARRLFSGFISAKTLDQMWRPVSEPFNSERTLGWDMPSKTGSMLGTAMSHKSVGHWGYTGTSLWLDPEEKFAVTLLSNRVHPSRENILIRTFRPRFHDALMEDLRFSR
jgi:CubicO group peptidase (beta-lactamase class C family)